jgi:preprotein translocase subunit SecE
VAIFAECSNVPSFRPTVNPIIVMNKLQAYFKDSYREMLEKVTWPTWAQLQQSTMIVLVATLVITGLVWLMDLASSNILKFVYSLFK